MPSRDANNGEVVVVAQVDAPGSAGFASNSVRGSISQHRLRVTSSSHFNKAKSVIARSRHGAPNWPGDTSTLTSKGIWHGFAREVTRKWRAIRSRRHEHQLSGAESARAKQLLRSLFHFCARIGDRIGPAQVKVGASEGQLRNCHCQSVDEEQAQERRGTKR